MSKTKNPTQPHIRRESLDIKPLDYQPTLEELFEEFDMPEAIIEQMRSAEFKLVEFPKSRRDSRK